MHCKNQSLRSLSIALLLSIPHMLGASAVFADKTLVANATILTMAPDQPAPFRGYMLFDSSGIIALGAGDFAGSTAGFTLIDASSQVLMPGFVSGHNHLWQSAFRGIAADGELFPWLQSLHWTYGDDFSDGDFYAFTLQGALDQLQHGITTTYSHSQRLGGSEAQYLESLQASLDAGQHFVFAYNSNLQQSDDAIRGDIAALHERVKSLPSDSALLELSLNSVGAYKSEAKFALEMELAREYGMTVQIHYLEQFQRREKEREEWPMFQRVGAVAGSVSYAHFIHTTDAILEDTAAVGGAMIWNPLSNGRLASGLADIPRYLKMGVGVGMGVDGAASADIADPFENMRMGMYALRMQRRDASVMSPMQVLELHTLATARVLGIDDRVGSLEPGKRADFLLLDLSLPVTGPVFDLPASIVFAASAANITSVYVNGAERVAGGEIIAHDMVALNAEVEKRVAAIVSRVDGKGS
ncbi:MAG: amidohydrolase family protein [Pseudomonadota bacterium]